MKKKKKPLIQNIDVNGINKEIIKLLGNYYLFHYKIFSLADVDLNGQIKTKQKSRKNRPHHIDTDPLTDQTGFSLIFLLNYFLSCPLCRSHFTSPFPPKLNNKDKNRTKLHYQKTNDFFFFSVLKSRKLCVLTLENKQ